MDEAQHIAGAPNTDRPILSPLPGSPAASPSPDVQSQSDSKSEDQSESEEAPKAVLSQAQHLNGLTLETLKVSAAYKPAHFRVRNHTNPKVTMDYTPAEAKFLSDIAPEFRSAMNLVLKNRKRAIAYYYKNRDKITKERASKRDVTSKYNKEWYKQNIDYARARMRLMNSCFPHRKKATRLALRTGMSNRELGASLVTPEHDRKCEETYRILLCELRKAFGRDPSTGFIIARTKAKKTEDSPSCPTSGQDAKDPHQGDSK